MVVCIVIDPSLRLCGRNMTIISVFLLTLSETNVPQKLVSGKRPITACPGVERRPLTDVKSHY
jgi:hypothetical protein